MTFIKMPAGVPMWPVVRLSPYFRNPRTHSEDQVKTMARMMARFGWTDPIIVDEANGILAGHLRYAAALHLGLKEVPVIEVTHLSAEEKRAFVVGHNSIATRSRWDDKALASELHAISDEVLLELAGFSEAELDALDAKVEGGIQSSDFHPNLDPETGGRQYDAEDVAAAQGALEDKAKRREYLEKVVCPHCAEEFYLSSGKGAGNGGS